MAHLFSAIYGGYMGLPMSFHISQSGTTPTKEHCRNPSPPLARKKKAPPISEGDVLLLPESRQFVVELRCFQTPDLGNETKKLGQMKQTTR